MGSRSLPAAFPPCFALGHVVKASTLVQHCIDRPWHEPHSSSPYKPAAASPLHSTLTLPSSLCLSAALRPLSLGQLIALLAFRPFPNPSDAQSNGLHHTATMFEIPRAQVVVPTMNTWETRAMAVCCILLWTVQIIPANI